MRRQPRRVARAIAVAAVLGGAPSTAVAVVRARGDVGRAAREVATTTRAIGVLVPPGRPGLVPGALAHGAISVLMGVALAEWLPRRHGTAWAVPAGLAMGVLNVAVIGRRFPAIRALPLAPQLADNVAFAVLVAAVAEGGAGPEPLAWPPVRHALP